MAETVHVEMLGGNFQQILILNFLPLVAHLRPYTYIVTLTYAKTVSAHVECSGSVEFQIFK